MASMPVATSSPIKRSAGEGEEKKEGSSREASPASKRQKLDAGGSSSGSGGKHARTVSPTKPDGSKVKAGLPKLDVAAAASRASDAAAGGLFFQSNIQPVFSPGKSGEGVTTPLFDTPTTPHPSREAAEKAKQEAEAEERERMQLLVSSFTEDQLDRCQEFLCFPWNHFALIRYAMYRRGALPKATIKKVMQTITGTSVGHNVVIAMAGIAKVFAGEVVEEALKNLEDSGEGGQPLKYVLACSNFTSE